MNRLLSRRLYRVTTKNVGSSIVVLSVDLPYLELCDGKGGGTYSFTHYNKLSGIPVAIENTAFTAA